MTDTPETRPFDVYRGGGKTPHQEGRYLADPKLVTAVNAAIALQRALLLTGDAGTGKTMLAHAVADELGLPLRKFQVRSDHRGREILYHFDDMHRFYDAQVKDAAAEDRSHYLRLGPLGEAFASGERAVVLIDEIDKAPRDFPNDLLDALDEGEFTIPAIGRTVTAAEPPIVIITSNRESRLPRPFLRRCVFHHIEFPDEARLNRILEQRLGPLGLEERLRTLVVRKFRELRGVGGLEHQPATGELLAWTRVLLAARMDVDEVDVVLADLPHLGAVIKTVEDLGRVGGGAG